MINNNDELHWNEWEKSKRYAVVMKRACNWLLEKKLSTHINRCAYAVCANQSIKRKDIEIRLIFPTNTTAENCVITGIHTLSCILAGNTLSKIHHVLIKQRNGIKFPGGQLLLGPRDVFAYLWGTQNALTQIQIHSNSLHSAPLLYLLHLLLLLLYLYLFLFLSSALMPHYGVIHSTPATTTLCWRRSRDDRVSREPGKQSA